MHSARLLTIDCSLPQWCNVINSRATTGGSAEGKKKTVGPPLAVARREHSMVAATVSLGVSWRWMRAPQTRHGRVKGVERMFEVSGML